MFLSKSERQKRLEGIGRKVQFYFLLAQLHISFFKDLLVLDCTFAYQNFFVEKYDYDNIQKLPMKGVLKKWCAAGISFLGEPKCSAVLELP